MLTRRLPSPRIQNNKIGLLSYRITSALWLRVGLRSRIPAIVSVHGGSMRGEGVSCAMRFSEGEVVPVGVARTAYVSHRDTSSTTNSSRSRSRTVSNCPSAAITPSMGNMLCYTPHHSYFLPFQTKLTLSEGMGIRYDQYVLYLLLSLFNYTVSVI